VLDLAAADAALPRDMLERIRGGAAALDAVRSALAGRRWRGREVLAPIRARRRTSSGRKNYREHAREFASPASTPRRGGGARGAGGVPASRPPA